MLDNIADEPLYPDPMFPVEPTDKNPADELARQAMFLQLARYRAPYILIAAIPNAGKRGPAAVRRVKREGLRKGMADLICFGRNGKCALIEFKSGKGTVSPDQVETLNRLVLHGVPCAVFRDPENALNWLLEQEGFLR